METDIAPVEKRGPGRPPNPRPEMHPEDPRARASERAKEILGHMADLDTATDEFYIPPSLIPDGWTVEWKRWSVYNNVDQTHINELLRRGWEFVEYSPHWRDLVGPDYKEKRIFIKGCVLMQIPTEVHVAYRNRQKYAADRQVKDKEAQLTEAPPGTFDRDNKGNSLVKVKSSWHAMKVPD